MFGCLVAGRLLQTNLQQVDETHAIFILADIASINHICVFLLGTIPFPEGYAATVHIHTGKGFQLLGMISNEKPSAIFRLKGTFTPHTDSTPAASYTPTSGTSDAVIGISIEPMDAVLAQVSTIPRPSDPTSLNQSSSMTLTPVRPNRLSDPAFLAEAIVRQLFNYISSFAPSPSSGGASVIVELKDLQNWYEGFLRKLKSIGPSFLERND